MRASGAILVGFALLAIGLAVGIGTRLSDQAVAALAGAACGVGIAAPLGIAIGAYVGSSRARLQPAQPPAAPQVIVVPAPNAPPLHTPQSYPIAPPLMPAPRSFTIIGDAHAEDERS
jgi:hypothetical protein